MTPFPVILLLLSAGQVWCFSLGPPTSVSGVPTDVGTTLVPTSSAPHVLQSGAGNFSLFIIGGLVLSFIPPGVFFAFKAGVDYSGK